MSSPDPQTSDVSLPEELRPLLEELSGHGGAAEILTTLFERGWKLVPPTVDASGLRVRAADASELRAIWEEMSGELALDDYRRMAKRALGLGELLMACDFALTGLALHPSDAELIRLHARSQAEMGRTETARLLVEALVAEGHEDSETLGLLGRTWKDEGFARLVAGGSPDEAWLHSAEAYGRAFKLHEDYFTGINAATMAFFHGNTEKAKQIAGKVRQLAANVLANEPGDHWALATLGEAALLTRDWAESEICYRRAAALVSARSTDRVSMGRQVRRLLASPHWNDPDIASATKWVDEVFPLADVLVFSGHRFDLPDREKERFPESSAERVSGTLRAWLRQAGTQVVYQSMSAGADLLMAEAALELGLSLRLVLPKPVADVWRVSGEPLTVYQERFMRVCGRADAITVLGDGSGPDEGPVFTHCNQVLTGLALLDADSLGVRVRGLAVWNGGEGDSSGGTAECVGWWRQLEIRVDVIDPVTGTGLADAAAGNCQGAEDAGEGLVVRSMLFADVEGFSKLDERELQIFTEEFRGDLARLVADPAALEMVNTWGDGVIMVFRDAVAAARMALAFRDLVTRKDWLAVGLSRQLGMRIGLHEGPVWAVKFDPILRKPEFSGGNINRAARIEPITEVGQIYASDSFAALARLGSDPGLKLDYVGTLPLVKLYGRQRLFRLDRSGADDADGIFRRVTSGQAGG